MKVSISMIQTGKANSFTDNLHKIQYIYTKFRPNTIGSRSIGLLTCEQTKHANGVLALRSLSFPRPAIRHAVLSDNACVIIGTVLGSSSAGLQEYAAFPPAIRSEESLRPTLEYR